MSHTETESEVFGCGIGVILMNLGICVVGPFYEFIFNDI